MIRHAIVLLLLAAPVHAFRPAPEPAHPLAMPPCNQELPLGPEQTAASALFEGFVRNTLAPGRVSGSPIPVTAGRGPSSLERTCADGVGIVTGTARESRFYITTDRKWIFAEVAFDIDEIIRQPHGRSLSIGDRVTVLRSGGVVCTAAGQLAAFDFMQSFLTAGSRYLLHVTDHPASGRLVTSEHDYILTPDTAHASVHNVEPVPTLAEIRNQATQCD